VSEHAGAMKLCNKVTIVEAAGERREIGKLGNGPQSSHDAMARPLADTPPEVTVRSKTCRYVSRGDPHVEKVYLRQCVCFCCCSC
jgi:hypothetical protein